MLVAAFMVVCCGGGNETAPKENNSTTQSIENSDGAEKKSDGEFDFSSADEATETYAEMMEAYANLLAEGNETTEEKYLKSLTSLEKYVTSNFSNQTELLKSMTVMSEGIMDLQ